MSTRDKIEFCYKHRRIFKYVVKHNWYPKLKESPLYIRAWIRYLTIEARIELGYSENTGDADLMFSLVKYYEKIIL